MAKLKRAEKQDSSLTYEGAKRKNKGEKTEYTENTKDMKMERKQVAGQSLCE